MAARKHPGVAEKVLATVMESDQRTYRGERATQEKNSWTMYYKDLRKGKDPPYSLLGDDFDYQE